MGILDKNERKLNELQEIPLLRQTDLLRKFDLLSNQHTKFPFVSGNLISKAADNLVSSSPQDSTIYLTPIYSRTELYADQTRIGAKKYIFVIAPNKKLKFLEYAEYEFLKAANQDYKPLSIALGESYLSQGNEKLALEYFAHSCKNSTPEGCEKLSSIANSTYIKNHFPDIFELLAGENLGIHTEDL